MILKICCNFSALLSWLALQSIFVPIFNIQFASKPLSGAITFFQPELYWSKAHLAGAEVGAQLLFDFSERERSCTPNFMLERGVEFAPISAGVLILWILHQVSCNFYHFKTCRHSVPYGKLF